MSLMHNMVINDELRFYLHQAITWTNADSRLLAFTQNVQDMQAKTIIQNQIFKGFTHQPGDNELHSQIHPKTHLVSCHGPHTVAWGYVP